MNLTVLLTSRIKLATEFHLMVKIIVAMVIGTTACNTHPPDMVDKGGFSISDPNLTMELVAENPVIKTPIGLAIDRRDALYVPGVTYPHTAR